MLMSLFSDTHSQLIIAARAKNYDGSIIFDVLQEPVPNIQHSFYLTVTPGIRRRKLPDIVGSLENHIVEFNCHRIAETSVRSHQSSKKM